MAAAKARLESEGFRVYIVPEAATMIFAGGATVDDIGVDGDTSTEMFQTNLMLTQIHLEELFASLGAHAEHSASKCAARSKAGDVGHQASPCVPRGTVLLCDRGLMDGRAYMSDAAWSSMLRRVGLDEAQIHARYDMVVHLVTAALDAEAHYTLEQNGRAEEDTTRTEGIEKARWLDGRTDEVWTGHPCRPKVPNAPGASFQDKLDQTCDTLSRGIELILAGQTPSEVFRNL
jgi:hypothetical protein